ncbi:MAG: hypothetical protein LBC91_01630 [Candidatus Accumulibacter sp.]|jgi:hypothetical protein|nr:hypothetical protein [Accumulibacter sp.]
MGETIDFHRKTNFESKVKEADEALPPAISSSRVQFLITPKRQSPDHPSFTFSDTLKFCRAMP